MMLRFIAGAALFVGSSAAVAAEESKPTDFGVRVADGAQILTPIVEEGGFKGSWAPSSKRTNLAAAAKIGARWGRVTSTYRSAAKNRAVGGVPNSFHLSGRAIDIARRPGVRHSDIVAAYRNAGYRLVESLDEGDHSHLAFAFGGPAPAPVQIQAPTDDNQRTAWRFVYAPGGGR